MRYLKNLPLALLCSVLLAPGPRSVAQKAKPNREYLEWLVAADHPNWDYRPGEAASLTLHVALAGLEASGVKVYYKLSDAEPGAAVTEGEAVSEGGVLRIPVGTRATPGFRRCLFHFADDPEQKGDYYVGYGQRQVKCGVECPDDFDAFWRKEVDKARAVPYDAQVTRVDSLCTAAATAYKVRLTICDKPSAAAYPQAAPGPRYIFGWLAVPTTPGRHPALFTPPGAGVKTPTYSDDYAREGFLHFAIEIHGLDPDLTPQQKADIKARIDPYPTFGLQKGDRVPDTYYYRNVYVACVRSVDWLLARPEWDGQTCGVTGGSQGGALSLVTAALHKQINFAAVFYPALCDLLGALQHRQPGWPRFFDAKPAYKAEADTDAARRILPYYDAVNFARRIRVPILFSYGLNDHVVPAPSVAQAIAAQPENIQTILVTPTSAHWRFPHTQQQAIRWMKERF